MLVSPKMYQGGHTLLSGSGLPYTVQFVMQLNEFSIDFKPRGSVFLLLEYLTPPVW